MKKRIICFVAAMALAVLMSGCIMPMMLQNGGYGYNGNYGNNNGAQNGLWQAQNNQNSQGGISGNGYGVFMTPEPTAVAYDASLYIPYVEAAISDTQDYFYNYNGDYCELEPYSYGKLYDITGDENPELFTIHNSGLEALFEIFTQKNGRVEKIFEKSFLSARINSDNGFMGIAAASGNFGMGSDRALVISYGLADPGGYESTVEIYCIKDTQIYLEICFEVIVEDDNLVSVKKINADGSSTDMSMSEYIKFASKIDGSADSAEAIFGNIDSYNQGYYNNMVSLSDLLRQLKS